MVEWIVRLEDVEKTYRMGSLEVRALKGVSLSIPPGGFVSIAGPYGSGRTTLLNIIGCLCQPSSGRVMICGVNTREASNESLSRLRSRSIGFFSQASSLIPDLTVIENLELSLHLQGEDHQGLEDKVLDMLSEVGLGQKGNLLPGQLSSNISRRVALAKSLITDPQLLVCDNPTAGLGKEDTKELIELLAMFNEKKGMAVVIGISDRGIARRTKTTMVIDDGILVNERDDRGE